LFPLGTSRPAREEQFFDLVNQQWQAALAAMTPAPVQFSVQAGPNALPVYFFRPDDSGVQRPTLIISSGSDGQNVESMQFGVVAGLERGYNVARFEGPGQMSLLFRQKIPFTPDWNQVIGPIVAALAARPDVRSDRIGLVGVSFAGLLCARAAARTRGLAAVVLEPAAIDMADVWDDPKNLATVRTVQKAPPAVRAKARREMNAGFIKTWPHLSPDEQFVIHKRSEILTTQALDDARAGRPPSDYFGVLEAILRFSYAADYRAITIPTLLTANDGDTFFGRQPYEALRSPGQSARRGQETGGLHQRRGSSAARPSDGAAVRPGDHLRLAGVPPPGLTLTDLIRPARSATPAAPRSRRRRSSRPGGW
jgi:hypothetical protein